MKTTTVVLSTLVAAGATSVQARPFFGNPAELALSALMGRGLTGDNVIQPNTQKAEQHAANDVRKDINAAAKDIHAVKVQSKDGVIVPGVGKVGVCADVTINGIAQQKCQAKEHPKGNGGNGRGNRGQAKPNPKSDPDHRFNGEAKLLSKEHTQQCADDVHLLQLKVNSLTADKNKLQQQVTDFKHKVADYEHQIAGFEAKVGYTLALAYASANNPPLQHDASHLVSRSGHHLVSADADVYVETDKHHGGKHTGKKVEHDVKTVEHQMHEAKIKDEVKQVGHELDNGKVGSDLDKAGQKIGKQVNQDLKKADHEVSTDVHNLFDGSTLSKLETATNSDLRKVGTALDGEVHDLGKDVDHKIHKDGIKTDKDIHKDMKAFDENFHDEAWKIDASYHQGGKKLDNSVHKDANDVDDYLMHDGQKIDYTLKDTNGHTLGNDVHDSEKNLGNDGKEIKKGEKKLDSTLHKDGQKSGLSDAIHKTGLDADIQKLGL